MLKVIKWSLGVIFTVSVLWFLGYRAFAGMRMVSLTSPIVEKPHSNELTRIRIGCYNIAHARGGELGLGNWEGGSKEERAERLREIGRLIGEQKLDVLILNEVDFNCTWSHGVNQAAYLAKRGGFFQSMEQRNVDVSIPFFRVSIGNVVLSQRSLGDAKAIAYPGVNVWEPLLVGKKNGGSCLMKREGAERIRVFPIHVETRDSEVRRASVEAVIREAKSFKGSTILAGDFNAENKAGSVIDEVLAQGVWQPGGGVEDTPQLLTFPSGNLDRRIDWIFVPQSWREISFNVVESDLSDHLMLVGEWEIR